MSRFTYVSNTKEFTVEIDSSLLEDCFIECDKSSNYETGGILIGNYSDDMRTAVIRNISKAPSDSKRGRANFKRGVKGLIDVLNKAWAESGNYYLGEWHYHPNNSSKPSRTDVQQMNELSRNRRLKCPEPILLIIGGNNRLGWDISLHVFKNNITVELFILE